VAEPGQYQLTWDGTNEHGNQIHSGVFYVRLEAPGALLTRTLALYGDHDHVTVTARRPRRWFTNERRTDSPSVRRESSTGWRERGSGEVPVRPVQAILPPAHLSEDP